MLDLNKYSGMEKLHIGVMIKILKRFEEQNNLAPLFVLNEILEANQYIEIGGLADIRFIKEKNMNKILDKINLDKKTTNEALMDLSKSFLFLKERDGAYQFNSSLKDAIKTIEFPVAHGCKYLINVKNPFEKYIAR